MCAVYQREREWLDYIVDLLATPILALPQEPIAQILLRTFDSAGCAFNSVEAGTSDRRMWPPDFFGQEGSDVARWAANSSPSFHPILRYYFATGTATATQIADVPDSFHEGWRKFGWDGFYREYGAQHQLALPLHVAPDSYRAFVVGRDSLYEESEIHLARSMQRLLIGLDRQASALAHWSSTSGSIGAAAAADVRLTPREVSVIVLMAEGITAAAASHRLAIAERTVHKHLERIYAKLGVSERVSAVLRAQQMGLLRPSREGPMDRTDSR